MIKYLLLFICFLATTSYAASSMDGGKIMPIVTMDQPQHQVLREMAQPVTFPLNVETIATIENLKTTFASLASPYGKPAGLAAPQIGVSLRIFIVQVPPEAKQKRERVYDTLPPTIYINPSYVPVKKAGMYKDWEGCYSVPGKMGEVERYNEIKFTAYTVEGKKIHRIAKGFLARLLQHETDHLNGKDYTDYSCAGCRFGNEDVMLKVRAEERAKKMDNN
jgi:peptide deformylase